MNLYAGLRVHNHVHVKQNNNRESIRLVTIVFLDNYIGKKSPNRTGKQKKPDNISKVRYSSSLLDLLMTGSIPVAKVTREV